MSLSITKASSSIRGNRIELVSACGVRTYSVCVPSISLPRIQPPVVQWEYMPRRQYSHLPHDEMHEIRTRPAGAESGDGRADGVDYPDTLVPRMRPGAQVATSP